MLKNKYPKLAVIIGTMLIVAVLLVAGCATTGGGASTADIDKLSKRVTAVEKDIDTQKTKINPGLGTVMIEYGDRFSRAFFGAKAGNWDMVKYQIKEMREIQEVGEIDRPKRATALKNFESKFLDPLDKAAAAKDTAKFDSAFTNAIDGCNDCHAASSDATFKSFSFIKIQIPQTEPTGGLIDYVAK